MRNRIERYQPRLRLAKLLKLIENATIIVALISLAIVFSAWLALLCWLAWRACGSILRLFV